MPTWGPMTMSAREQALFDLGTRIRDAGYAFVTITPASHARVLARPARSGVSLRQRLREAFGWSRPFAPDALPASMVNLLEAADALEPCEDQGRQALRSRVRFSALGGDLFVHSAYPTVGHDTVFFGPDTYRFCNAVRRARVRARRVVDVGCGGGAGGIVAGREAGSVVLADVNEGALALARVNVALASAGPHRYRTPTVTAVSDVLRDVEGPLDLVVSNPPYLRDPLARAYRDGGGAFGEALAVRIVRESLARLSPGGTLLLYTGAPIVDGDDVFFGAVDPLLAARGARVTYEELDPDVFGEELATPPYAEVDRLAAVMLRADVP